MCRGWQAQPLGGLQAGVQNHQSSWPRPQGRGGRGRGLPPLSGFLDPQWAQLAVQTKRVAAQVDGGAQVQQVLNIECLRDFLTPPLLSVRFR